MKSKKELIWCLLICFCWGCNTRQELSFYVSNQGDDNNQGSLKQPLLTLENALEKAKIYRKENTECNINIYLREGVYYLDRTLLLTPEFNGDSKAFLSIRAYASEKPVVSGGNRLHLNWEPYRDGIYRAELEEKHHFEQLFVNGKRQVLARYPDYDPDIKPFSGFSADADSPEKVKEWKNPKNGYLHALHRLRWGGFSFRISGVKEDGTLEMEGGWQNQRKESGIHKTFKYVENIFEELDNSGEWFLDREDQILYFFPPEDVDLKTATIEVPVLEQLFVFQGTEEHPVRNIRVDGLTLRHTTRTFMKTDEPLSKSDWTIYRGGSIFAEGTEDITILNCFFDAVGGNAVFFSNYNRDGLITGNKITGSGANGVCFVGNPDAKRSPDLRQELKHTPIDELDTVRGPKSNDYPANCRVYDNLIHDIGVWEKQIAGVQISMSSSITVSHNSIYNVPRAGINISDGTWGGHIIEFNDVFNTVLETGDHGSFNSWGRDRWWKSRPPRYTEEDSIAFQYPNLILADHIKPTIIRNNRMRCDHGWDIDLDDGSSNYQLYNNLCLNGGIKIREGFYRKAYNNILVNSSFYFQLWFEGSNDTIVRNIVTGPYKPLRIPEWHEVDYNLHPSDSSLMFAHALGIDTHGDYGDPQFTDPLEGDYTVREGSPALGLGFQNFPMDQFGVIKQELKNEALTPRFPEEIFEVIPMTMFGDIKNK